MQIKLSEIHLSPTNPRCRLNEKLDAELVESIKRHGVLQPVLVRAKALLKQPYELVAGSRRYHAAIAAGLHEIPAIEKALTDAEVLEVQIIENLQRSDVHPLEEAEAYRKLHESYKYDVARIAERVGRSVAYVYDRIRLCSLTKDAAEHFRAGRIQAGHAILLARLKPADQTRALDVENGGVFQNENTLWNPARDRDEAEAEDKDPFRSVKARTAKELQAWIDRNVKFDPRAEDVPDLFPETAEAVGAADRVVPITWEHQVPPPARDGQRVIVQTSWRRADGRLKSKRCENSLMGVVVIGPGRGEAFDVCVDKTCKVHWADKIKQAREREKAKAAGGAPQSGAKASEQARYAAREKAEAEKRAARERLQKRWAKATPEILKALAGAVEKIPASKLPNWAADLASWIERHDMSSAKAAKYVPAGKSLEQIFRHLIFLSDSTLVSRSWDGFEHSGAIKKELGVDCMAIVDRVAPDPDAKPTAPAKAKGTPKAKRSAKKKAGA